VFENGVHMRSLCVSFTILRRILLKMCKGTFIDFIGRFHGNGNSFMRRVSRLKRKSAYERKSRINVGEKYLGRTWISAV
jgi:hypothetical protein